jgi:5-methyltetrahydrofolate--homocysteine methyltransferase
MLNDIQEALLKGKKEEVEKLVEQALSSGLPTARILNEGLVAGMDRLGIMFKNNEVFIPEVLVAARAMNAGLAKLEPFLVRDGIQPKGSVVIGTVKGDLHDIGKNLVAMMLEGGGFEVVDLGVDVSPDKFVEATRKHKPEVVAMSALLTTTMGGMKTALDAIAKAGFTNQVKTIVGGAPLTEKFAREIGADGYAPDAASAVDRVRELLGSK